MIVFVSAFFEEDVERDALEVASGGGGAFAIFSVDAVG